MPELPEVETVARQLNKELKGSTISGVSIRFGKKISPDNFSDLAIGKQVVGASRRAKILIIKLSDGLNILVHLKMTGKTLLKESGFEPDKHTHAIIHFADKEIHWNDVRKFGWLKLMNNQEMSAWFKKESFGPEPLDESFSADSFIECLRARPKSKIKVALLDPHCIAGIGNIYATEVLWESKIHPMTKIEDLSDKELTLLYESLTNILKAAIPKGGTSSDNFKDAYGKNGRFVDELKVYKNEKGSCPRCSNSYQKMKIGGRGSIFCPKCQSPR